MNYKIIKRVHHYIYDSVEEFHTVHPNIAPRKNWRTGNEGEWVITDEGGVCQLLRVIKAINHPGDSKNYTFAKGYVRCVTGTYLNNDDVKMLNDIPENIYTFGRNTPQWNVGRNKKSFTKKERIFTAKVMMGIEPKEAVKTTYETQNDYQAKLKAGVLLKKERIMSEINNGVQDVLEDLKIDDRYILQGYKDFFEDETIDPNVRIRALNRLTELKGIMPEKKRITSAFSILNDIREGFTDKDLQIAERPKEIEGPDGEHTNTRSQES
ncbi:hypothetical protein ACFL4H_00090 [Candidatus Neomarinimicrobiota bacterium]